MLLAAVSAACAADPGPDPIPTPDPTVATTAGSVPAAADTVAVVRVSDGDSLVVDVGGVHERVRLVGINAPELDACWGEQARRHLEELAGTEVAIASDVSDRDQYERLLRLAWTPDGRLINEELVAEGSALAISTPPDLTHVERLRTAQQRARDAGRGLWAADACGPSVDAEIGFSAAVFNPPGDDLDPVDGERVTITNRGSTEATIGGWEIGDEGPHRFRFPPGFRLAAGESVTVYSACGDDVPGFLYWCADGAVWSNGGDTAHLRDASGNVVDTAQPFGDPPRVTP